MSRYWFTNFGRKNKIEKVYCDGPYCHNFLRDLRQEKNIVFDKRRSEFYHSEKCADDARRYRSLKFKLIRSQELTNITYDEMLEIAKRRGKTTRLNEEIQRRLRLLR